MNTTNMREQALRKGWFDKPPQLKQPLWTLLCSLTALLLTSCSLEATEGAVGQGGASGLGGAGLVATCTSKDCDSSNNKPSDNSAARAGESPIEEALVKGDPQGAIACTKDTDCASGFCTDGVCCNLRCDDVCMACTAAIKGSGVDGVCGPIKYDTDPQNECPNGACNGAYVCEKYNGVGCGLWTECLSHYCVDGVCCNSLCNTECVACSAAKKGTGYDGQCGNIKIGLDPDNECNPRDCNGAGACASIQSKFPNGTPCQSYAQCSSGFCADGVCCDSPCRNPNIPGQTNNWCQACTAAKKGGGIDGVCGPIAFDSDPDNECWGGACDGNTHCKLYDGHACDKTTQCLSDFCTDGVCCNNFCGSGCAACTQKKKGDGTQDGLCGWIVSGTDPDNECNPGECNATHTCNAPQTPQANGTPCSGALQCASGFCADGVCCDSFCVGECLACTAAKKGAGTTDGTCGPVAGGTDPDLECPGGGCAGTIGACKFYNGVACNTSADCISTYCVDGVCCGNICNLPCMACTAAKKGSGVDGSCGNIAAGADPDTECADPSQCNGAGACQ